MSAYNGNFSLNTNKDNTRLDAIETDIVDIKNDVISLQSRVDVTKIYEPMYSNGEPIYAGSPLDIVMGYGGNNAS